MNLVGARGFYIETPFLSVTIDHCVSNGQVCLAVDSILGFKVQQGQISGQISATFPVLDVTANSRKPKP